jgi:hypothetical protein
MLTRESYMAIRQSGTFDATLVREYATEMGNDLEDHEFSQFEQNFWNWINGDNERLMEVGMKMAEYFDKKFNLTFLIDANNIILKIM